MRSAALAIAHQFDSEPGGHIGLCQVHKSSFVDARRHATAALSNQHCNSSNLAYVALEHVRVTVASARTRALSIRSPPASASDHCRHGACGELGARSIRDPHLLERFPGMEKIIGANYVYAGAREKLNTQ